MTATSTKRSDEIGTETIDVTAEDAAHDHGRGAGGVAVAVVAEAAPVATVEASVLRGLVHHLPRAVRVQECPLRAACNK